MSYLGANVLTDLLSKAKETVADKVDAATGGAGAKLLSSATDTATSQAAGLVTANKSYQINRERFAVVTKTGYDWMDKYTAAKPTLFVVGIVGFLASSFALYKRRKKGPETISLYSATAIASAALAFLTKPGISAAAKDAPAVASTSPGAMKSMMAWADKKGAALTTSQPGWERNTLTRLWNDVGQGPMQPAVNVLLTKNSH